jgi:DNA (cytosine-5)-methyltransferase 1
MSPANCVKVDVAKKSGLLAVGAVYKRTRRDATGKKIQRAEVRFDGVAGCLRTPAGGSSRQVILLVKGQEVHSRLLSSREAARLMGLPDSYMLPGNYYEAYRFAGDGVAIPVVRHIAQSILEPILEMRGMLQAAE